ncbi:acetyltransferase [Pontibacillus halophilus JSM 076056 = DSM 19796]|uniref:Acetyltransferase n=1 Tax=Pontibacillus halophilus JSM 076056 = DSM 19796 TaxID=1385510 RepID=A0A0A5I517_9BACI|nr:acetyltransferase [Pontibacillus halophilus JSM 076056 = DSM 19796]
METKRLILRYFRREDAKRLQEIYHNKKVASTTTIPYPYTIEDATNWIESHEELIEYGGLIPYAIVLKTENRLIGSISLRIHVGQWKGELAAVIDEEYWGKGYGTEAAKACLDEAFSEKGINKVFAQAIGSNHPSIETIKKIGMKLDGSLRQDLWHDGQFKDVLIFSILKREWESEGN